MRKVLVVDNDRFMLQLVEDILSKEGYAVTTAEGGLAALDLLTQDTPDVIIVDLVMPGIDGRKLCRIFRGMPMLENTILIILSAVAGEEALDPEQLGVDAIIPKSSMQVMKKQILRTLDETMPHAPHDIVKEGRNGSGLYAPGVIKELMSVKSHFEIILDRMSEGILEISSDGRILYANPKAVSLVSADETQLLGTYLIDLFEGYDRKRMAGMMAAPDDPSRRISDAKPIRLNRFEIAAEMLVIDDDDRTAIVIFTDVSERRQSERVLKKAKKYTENIINTMADSLIVLDPDLTIRLVNRATCDLLGYSEADLMGRPAGKIFLDEAAVDEMLNDGWQEKGTITRPAMAYRSKSGERIPVSFLGSAMYEDGHFETPAGIICIAHDMREIEALQGQVCQAEKMAATGVLSAGVAHEIKNPLAIILQGLESLAFSLASLPDNDIYSDMLARIKNAARRADAIVKGLLDFSRQTEVVFESSDAAGLIEEALFLLEHQFEQKGIAICRHYAPDVKDIRVDKNQIQQVFINLMVNAVESMPNGGTLTVATKYLESGPEGSCIQFIFSDTGNGISEESAQNIFEPFFTTKTNSLNTGLGLSVSQGIIEKHSGKIAIRSEMDKGTTVTVSLPHPMP